MSTTGARARPKRKTVVEAEFQAKRRKGETDLGLCWTEPNFTTSSSCRPLIVLSQPEPVGTSQIAAFDIDWTIIRTASGRQFGQGKDDWEWLLEQVPVKLKELDDSGTKVVFFTNQAGIEKSKVNVETLKLKFESMIRKLGIPVTVLVATGSNHFRKPSTEMWDYFVTKCNDGVQPRLEECIYVGDAAGRPAEWAPGKKKDFSASDRMFAANIGIAFKTPEEYFLGQDPVGFSWRTIDPATLRDSDSSAVPLLHMKTQELVLMCGMPASGKSSVCRKFFANHDYVVVSRDNEGTAQKCLKICAEQLKAGKSVVIDNTNPDEAARAPYVHLAQQQGIPCRCVVVETSADVAYHLNYVRQNMTKGGVRRIPMVAYRVFQKKFTIPTKKEGFQDIVRMPFVPRFDNVNHRTLFAQWTCSER